MAILSIHLHCARPCWFAPQDKKRKTVIIIDGVNQMRASDDAHKLRWVPFPLPKNIRVVISTLPMENGCLAALRGRTPKAQEMEVPMLAGDERVELVVESLAKYAAGRPFRPPHPIPRASRRSSLIPSCTPHADLGLLHPLHTTRPPFLLWEFVMDETTDCRSEY